MFNKTSTSSKVRLYEGCLVKIRGREEIFYIKGIFEEDGKYIALPRYIPHPEGNRVDNKGRRFKVLKTYEEQIEYVYSKVREILRYSKIFKMKIPMIDEEYIEEVYYPTEKTREILKNQEYEIDKVIVKIVKELQKDVPIEYIGICGSRLANLTGPEQDIDIVVVDMRYIQQIFERLRKLKTCEDYVIERLCNYHKGSLRIPYTILYKLLRRRILENSIDGYQYFIRILPMIDMKPILKYHNVEKICRLYTHVKIYDESKLSFTSPCIYFVESPIGNIPLISDRGIFSETLLLLQNFKVSCVLECGILEIFNNTFDKWFYLDSKSFISF